MVAAADQPYEPVLRPPAPSFASIAQRMDLDAAKLQKFIATTHRGLDERSRKTVSVFRHFGEAMAWLGSDRDAT